MGKTILNAALAHDGREPITLNGIFGGGDCLEYMEDEKHGWKFNQELI
jgi:hypothetical protein